MTSDDAQNLRKRIAKLQADVAEMQGTPIRTNLQAMRETLRITREQLADRTGIEAHRLERIETATTTWGVLAAERKAIEKAVHEDADFLLRPYDRAEVDARILKVV